MTEETILAAVAIIDGWKGRLTWNALCEAVAHETGAKYTRQALNNYVDISAAYRAYSKETSPSREQKSLSKSQHKIKTLERKVAELEAVRDALLEKFARWAVNASTQNLDENFLDQPLRQISRSENH